MDREDATQVAQYLSQRMAAPVSFDVWTRQESGLVRTDRDTCNHCGDALELARQLGSLHPALRITAYDLDKHASRAEEAGITLAPTTILRGNGRSIRLVGLFSGLLFPALLDIIWFLSRGEAPLPEETRIGAAELGAVEIEAMLAPYDPYSAHMARLLGAFAVESKAIKLQLTEIAELPVLASQRAVTEVPIVSINGRRFSGAWDDAPLLEQIQRVIAGNTDAVIRDRVLASEFLTEEQAIQRAREAAQREQGTGGMTAPTPGNAGGQASPGGLIIPGR
ncbi:MAG: hypothetical protein DWG79_00180 [Chloroflexi bacterium]|nr:hypothetical protein [Chloroflexota bacterium]